MDKASILECQQMKHMLNGSLCSCCICKGCIDSVCTV